MANLHSLTDAEVLAELGRRVRRRRLREDVPQAELAAAAGIGERTLRSLESGGDVQVSTLVRVLRALRRLDALDAVLPEPGASPMELLRSKGRERKRARRRRG